ncbi:Fip1 motif-domain-containing protein [Dactylonectria estremocensis]|uniref:Fip1 motif-domain-containing protein n=1 Tax=Dactylonectria estremocensis TaxID=1079267 RepID=A0A9P9JJD5_9HYPO|nr:Fip1 motif-domain-containing protein [Dactylonectria estremocensis]
MDIDEDDDLYVPEEPKVEPTEEKKPKFDDLEEGEEEDEGAAMDEDDDDSDIDIITERKDGSKPAPPPQSKYSDIRNIPQRSASTDVTVKAAPVKKDDESRQSSTFNVAAPSADKTSAAASKSTIDINANPIHAGSGKPITQVNIDEDLPENDKPWRKPGTDISDYFNYGFDEFTWALYASKQETVRGEFGADVFANNNKKMMEDFNSMMMMGGMGMGGGGGAGGAQGGMAGMDGMAPEMQAMMQQMMASGMDPSQMDPSQMNAMFAGMQNAGGSGAGGQGGHQGGNFGGGFGGNQGGFGGYDQNMAGGGGGGGGRGGFGGGRGRRGRW